MNNIVDSILGIKPITGWRTYNFPSRNNEACRGAVTTFHDDGATARLLPESTSTYNVKALLHNV